MSIHDTESEAVTMILHREPELRDPYLLAAWSGMGNVALGAARYLRDKLGAELFGEIRLAESFRFSGILVNDDGTLEFPRSTTVTSKTALGKSLRKPDPFVSFKLGTSPWVQIPFQLPPWFR